MSEVGMGGGGPQVFIVDSQASYINMPKEKKPRRMRTGHRLLLLLVGLGLLGLLVEGYFIYKLYQRSEFEALCQNRSNHKTSDQQGGNIMSQLGSKEINQIPETGTQTQQRPFAHLLGSSIPLDQNNVVQWVKEGEASVQNMKYDSDGLTVEMQGYYYLYSKVQLNAAKECLLIQHKVMKKTSAYDHPIELMKSNSFHCLNPKNSNEKVPGVDNLWNNYLAGIFFLGKGDQISVKLESMENFQMQPGLTENFMGAFMISP